MRGTDCDHPGDAVRVRRRVHARHDPRGRVRDQEHGGAALERAHALDDAVELPDERLHSGRGVGEVGGVVRRDRSDVGKIDGQGIDAGGAQVEVGLRRPSGLRRREVGGPDAVVENAGPSSTALRATPTPPAHASSCPRI